MGVKIRKTVRVMRSKKKQDAGHKALRLVKSVIRKEENKWSDQPQYTTALAQTFHTNSLVQISQGSSDTQRIGNKIQIKKLHLRCSFVMASAAVTKGNAVRCVILQDLCQVDSTDPTVSQIFVNSTDWNSSLNKALTDRRFKIYYDKTFYMRPYQLFDSNAAHIDSSEHMLFKEITIRPKGKYAEVGYSGTASSTVNWQGFYIVLAHEYDTSASVSQGVTPNIQCQVEYTDD